MHGGPLPLASGADFWGIEKKKGGRGKKMYSSATFDRKYALTEPSGLHATQQARWSACLAGPCQFYTLPTAEKFEFGCSVTCRLVLQLDARCQWR